MVIKKGLLAVLAALLAVLFLYPSPTQAQFKKDFLYKFQSRWTDIAVSSHIVPRIFIINESYSRIEEYNSSGVLQAIHGGFGVGDTQMNRPQAMTLSSTDDLYVLDSGNARVLVSTMSATQGSAFTFMTKWGSYGSGNGQFNNPSGIATDGTYVFIADTDNNRVQRCLADGTSCGIWPSTGNTFGTANGQFSSPKGIAYDASTLRVYVADTGNNRVQVFDTNGTYISKFGTYGASNGQLVLPYRVITETGNTYVYVMDTLNRIQRFIKNDESWSATLPLTTSGAGMKIMPGTPNSVLYVTSLPTTFQTYNESSLALTNTMTNDIGHPIDMSLDTYGNIYINNNFPLPNEPVIQKFNSSFIQQAEWTGSNGGVDGSFGISISGPLGIGINTGNDLYVADTDKNRIQKFTADGTYVYSLTPIPTIGVFSRPRDVATEATGKFYVADTGNSRVIKFSANGAADPNGGYIWARTLPAVGGSMPTPPVGSVPAPYGITVDSVNKIYVADAGYHRILRYDANGTYEAEWGTYGSADNSTIPQLDSPQGMAIDPSGNIYVADTGNNRIQRFDQNGTLATRVVWGVYGTQDGNFNIPRNVAVDAANRVFVSEVGNRRIQVFGDATASAGLTITQTGGTTINEGTSSATIGVDSYTVKLTTQPSAPVTVAITVSDPTQATVNTPSLAFTQYNWNIPQTVTVVPIHDFVSNGTRSVIISHKPTSTDPYYRNVSNISWSDVTVTITDTIDVPGITFSTNNVPLATEGATLANAYTIVLNTKPTANVVVSLAPDSSLQISPATITFTPTTGDWNTPRQVHILPIHDYLAQGTHVGTIFHSSTSTDTNYGPGVLFSDSSGNVSVNIMDIDAVGVVFSKPSVSVTENASPDTYTVNLASKPTQDVEVYIKDASPSALVSMDPSPLTFTPDTWSPLAPQTVTVTAVHDFLKNAVDPRTTNIEHFVTSGDTSYDALIATVSATVRDSDAGGLLIYKPGGGSVTIAEGGATDEYAFQLSSIPLNPVTVTLSSSDHQATTSAYIYSFTPSNWNTPQYATISAVDDSIQEGNHYGIITHTLSSLDPNFDGLLSYQTATITDNDVAGITARLPNGVINIAEAGPTDTYYVRLDSLPTAPVSLIFSAQNQATASPANLIFNASNWSDEQEITLSAIQDYMIEGPHTATISYTASSSDTNYNGKTASFTANISDDDSLSPGISIVESNGGTAVEQDSYTDTYTLALTSKPSANVKIKIVANGPEATTSAGIFWFTPNVWNVPQTVTVTAKRNPSGGATVIFTHLVTSLDAHYNGLFAPTVNVTVNEHRSSSSSSSSEVKAPVCSKSPPPNAPNLFQINTTQTEATLYFTPIKDNISYYFIAYGFTPGDLRFGTSFEFGSYDGVIDHTVSMLTPGTKYYFQIRGGNGCATGPWSGSVPATAVGLESSAQTVRTYYAPVVPIGTSGSSSSGGGSSPTGGIWLTRDLYPGSQGADVRSLQEHLNAHGFTLATSGAGSPGNETTYYGNLTAAAVRRFQEAHFAEILSPLGYASGTGICGPSTRNYINSHP